MFGRALSNTRIGMPRTSISVMAKARARGGQLVPGGAEVVDRHPVMMPEGVLSFGIGPIGAVSERQSELSRAR